MSTEELNNLPEFVRYFKCNDALENGDPYCGDEKYSSGLCDDRVGKAPWHPGWKSHAITGHALALFLLEALVEAVDVLLQSDTLNAEEMLENLTSEENALFMSATRTRVSRDFLHDLDIFPLDNDGNINGTEIDPSVFFDGPSICHTARLPSRARYMGYLTESDKVGGPSIRGNETYDTGMSFSSAMDLKSGPGSMTLVKDQTGMATQICADAIVAPDFKDSFFANGEPVWKELVFPNAAEQRAYSYDPSKLLGLILLVFTGCDWGVCDEGYLWPADLSGDSKLWDMKINGEQVESLVNFDQWSVMAKSKNGFYFAPNENGGYRIEVHVNDPKSFLKISSVIAY